jgi:hypothetical protein
VWAGSQVKCQPGRGSQDWTTELCFWKIDQKGWRMKK